jgi:hypothetical protein
LSAFAAASLPPSPSALALPPPPRSPTPHSTAFQPFTAPSPSGLSSPQPPAVRTQPASPAAAASKTQVNILAACLSLLPELDVASLAKLRARIDDMLASGGGALPAAAAVAAVAPPAAAAVAVAVAAHPLALPPPFGMAHDSRASAALSGRSAAHGAEWSSPDGKGGGSSSSLAFFDSPSLAPRRLSAHDAAPTSALPIPRQY